MTAHHAPNRATPQRAAPGQGHPRTSPSVRTGTALPGGPEAGAARDTRWVSVSTSTRPGALALLHGVVAARAAGIAVVYQFNHLTSAGEAAFRAAETTVISAREGLQITVSGPYKRLNLALAEKHCYRLVLDARHNTAPLSGASSPKSPIISEPAASPAAVA
jgi:hypothetical protein